jgi:hypothetical protein
MRRWWVGMPGSSDKLASLVCVGAAQVGELEGANRVGVYATHCLQAL